MLVAKKVLLKPDFDEKLNTVHTLSTLYSGALQSQAIREKQYEDILEWISPSSTNYITPKRSNEVGSTCHWFLVSDKYLEWVGQGRSTLICSGKGTEPRGSRITVFSWRRQIPSRVSSSRLNVSLTRSSVIFNRLLQTPRLGIIYFFFNHSDRTQTAENVVRVLLRQLLTQMDAIPSEVRNEYSRYKQDPHKRMPDRQMYSNLLKCSIEAFFKANKTRIFVLVDAYDELLSTDEEKEINALAEKKAIRSSLSQLSGTGHAKILISTRPHYCQELRNSFPGAIVADVHGDPEDMKTYIKSRLEPFNFHEALKSEIMEQLLKASAKEKW